MKPLTPLFRYAWYALVWIFVTALISVLTRPSLGAEPSHLPESSPRRVRIKRKLPASHKHRSVGRCLKSDGKTWIKGCV